ncbi:FHA domain-containing protein [bacterium]|nr:FHA domain-containing protein [bacterium]MCI0602815.1 FHA domain-containing protein [bacterium]
MGLAKLVLAEAFKPRKNILIDKNPFVIGRGADCDLTLDRSGISKRHARITFNGEEYLFEDLGSKNGAYVNGNRVQSANLQEGDLISLSGTDLIFNRIRQNDWTSTMETNIRKFRFALQSTKAMNSHQVLDPILNEIMDGVMRLSQAERGFLLIEAENGELQMARSVNINPEGLKQEGSNLSLSAVEKAIQTRTSVAISDAQQDTFFGDQTSVKILKLKTLVSVPIVVNGNVIGIIYADSNRREQEFTQLDVDVLESLAENAAIAIQNVRLNQQIWNLIQQASDVLSQLDQKAHLDDAMQKSVRSTLDKLSALKQKQGGDVA